MEQTTLQARQMVLDICYLIKQGKESLASCEDAKDLSYTGHKVLDDIFERTLKFMEESN